jgi:hypothetical protein
MFFQQHYFEKPLQDIPQDRLAVYHVVRSKKYFCENSDCSYTRFVERLDGFAEKKHEKQSVSKNTVWNVHWKAIASLHRTH